ncbi:riboflavin synthase, partial [Arthrobacter sp. SO5]|uniref:riboflavin synthase n=1 Tax=Arthrobacter sp. SO5 TaxID=1897055 RepID=UPI0035ABF382
MFTGIIAEQGNVLAVERDGDISATLRLHAPGTTEGLALGGSIAVNGVCLTATSITGKEFSVDVMGETLIRSTIGELSPGDTVNLERCVPAGGRLDGHVVQGHVDGVGQLLEREALGNWDRL